MGQWVEGGVRARRWDSPEGKPETTLMRNTGRTPGWSSTRLMAFRSNTLAWVPPGGHREPAQTIGWPTLQLACLVSSWLWGLGCGVGRRPLSEPGVPHPCWTLALSRFSSLWLWHLLRGTGADSSQHALSPGPLGAARCAPGAELSVLPAQGGVGKQCLCSRATRLGPGTLASDLCDQGGGPLASPEANREWGPLSGCERPPYSDPVAIAEHSGIGF